MGRTIASVLSALAAAGALGLAACQQQAQPAPTTGVNAGNGPPELTEPAPDRPREVRPPPATSGGLGSPDNPNGAPGPASGLGTSPSRY